MQVDYYYGRGARVLTPITFLASCTLTVNDNEVLLYLMSLLRVNYCMTCIEGLHFSAFHVYL